MPACLANVHLITVFAWDSVKPFTIPPNNRLAGCHFAIRLRNCKTDIRENLVAYLNEEICRRIDQNETKYETFRPKFNNQPVKLFIGHLSDVSNIQLIST